MNSFIVKGLVLAGVLIVATLVVIKQMHIDLSDPVNLITFLGAVAIAVLTFGVGAKYMAQMKTDTASGELAEENWDGIGEYKNELPSGWAWSYVGVMIWAIWYFLWGYPLNAYSQIGEYNKEVKNYQKKFEAKWKNPSPEVLRDMGESIFLVQCAPCHGETGDGLDGKAQDFTSRMTKEQILAVIKSGQHQLMYPLGAMPAGMASGKQAEEVAAWIAGGMKGKAPATWATCAGCHGQDGKGNGGSAPDLAEYDETLVKHVLKHGKKGIIGQMPAFPGRFTPVQEKALAAYLKTLKQ
ncbi:c-type cytochrome [Nitratifractor salsuginis]|uniref:Cytochrome c oxidase subunit III n=1 Tax=Nitratifractor salsuginis (strain DSM 16511 / JCM 12458 / E9I37-1) TaxID=749222 RepID=E6X2H4_NITSE|nr:c-type cytochrome [Nitratifractor salsuginis]ADV47179.1 cytochrome c class I [Nitratifractor salsuginis DSM 16511]